MNSGYRFESMQSSGMRQVENGVGPHYCSSNQTTSFMPIAKKTIEN